VVATGNVLLAKVVEGRGDTEESNDEEEDDDEDYTIILTSFAKEQS
jgi:hypothetical protein